MQTFERFLSMKKMMALVQTQSLNEHKKQFKPGDRNVYTFFL